jgi:fatty-acid desaturase
VLFAFFVVEKVAERGNHREPQRTTENTETTKQERNLSVFFVLFAFFVVEKVAERGNHREPQRTTENTETTKQERNLSVFFVLFAFFVVQIPRKVNTKGST